MGKKACRKSLVDLKLNDEFNENIVMANNGRKVARPVSLPEDLHPLLRRIKQKGKISLYTHQRTAYEKVTAGNSIVAVTPTASGKTLCYNLPVTTNDSSNTKARALYIFPTKALAQDQKSEINEMIMRGYGHK